MAGASRCLAKKCMCKKSLTVEQHYQLSIRMFLHSKTLKTIHTDAFHKVYKTKHFTYIKGCIF